MHLGYIAIGCEGEDLALEVPTCPGAYARMPEALEAQRALTWWEKAQLALLYPDGVTERVTEAVDAARAAKDEWLAEGIRLRAEQRKKG